MTDSSNLRIGPHAELRTPFFGNDFREAGHACLGHAVIYLAAVDALAWILDPVLECLRIAVDATGATDVDDISGLSILDTEIRRCSSDELERCGVVQCDYCLPLLVCHLSSISSVLVSLFFSRISL